jgi:hypothetical protein
MSGELSAEAREAIVLQQRANEILIEMYSTPGLLVRLQQGYEASERGEVVSLEEFEREIDRLDEAQTTD